jgi:hypothetical protein
MNLIGLRRSALVAVLVGIALRAGALPADASVRHQPEQNPDWPCVQRLVPKIAPGMVWTGPPLDSIDGSKRDRVIGDLAGELAARRIPLEDARSRVEALAKDLDPAEKDHALTRLFAATLQIINRDRASIIQGIKRFARQQRALSEEIEQMDAALRELKGDGSGEQQARRATLEEQREWSVRIFDEREDSLTYLCEQPVLLEQRAFALAREIAGHLN